MAELKALHVEQLPAVQHIGTQQRVHTAIWAAEVDEALPSDFALVLAQGIVGTPPSGVEPIPLKGSVLAMDDGKIIGGQTQASIGTWVLAGSGRYGDGGAVLLDFQAAPTSKGQSVNHLITGVWREPSASGLERSAFLNKFATGLTLPTPATVPSGGAQAIDPEDITAPLIPEPREDHVSYVTKESELRVVRQVATQSGAIGPPTLLRNPLGYSYPPFIGLERIMVVTIEQIVGTDEFAHQMNARFRNTMNSHTVTFQGMSIPPHFIRFLGAETSRTRSENGVDYKVLTRRLEINNEPYYERRPATGPSFRLPGRGTSEFVQKDDDGLVIPADYPLQENGELAVGGFGQFTHVFTRLNPVSYTGLI